MKSADVVSRLRSQKTVLALTVGLVSGIGLVVGEISLASLIFSGPLSAYSTEGIGLVLFGTCAASLVIAFAGGFPGAVAAPPVPSLIVLATIGGAISATGQALFATMVAIIVICALATGLLTLLIGQFRLANLVRFIPYPVSAGFVAGTGGVVCLVALAMMGVELDREALASLLEPFVATNWGVGVIYGLGLFWAGKRSKSFLLLPVSFLGATALFHLAFRLLDVSGEEAAGAGLLIAGIADGRLWPPAFGGEALALVDWAAVAGQLPNMLTLIVITLVCIVMQVGGLELAANREFDWNREFRAVGLAGVVAGVGGGPLGCMNVPTSMRSVMFGVDMRFTTIVVALITGSVLFTGDMVLRLVPMPLLAGVLLFTGLVMVDDWLVKVRKRIPVGDYAIIVAMFLTIVVFGFFEGMGVGIVVTIAFFVVRLSRIELVESGHTLRERRSQRIRSIPDRAILQSEGTRGQVYRLRGYIFFGSGYLLVNRLKESLAREPPPSCLLLDFTNVTGYDFSSVNALCRLLHAARGTGTRVVFAAAPGQLHDELQRNLPPPVFEHVLFQPDADRGLERSEDIVIEDHLARRQNDAAAGGLLEEVADAMGRHLDRQALFEELVEELRDWVEERTYGAGESIFAVGESSNGLQLVTAGGASVYDDSGNRTAQCGPGDVVERHGLFGTASTNRRAVADETCRTVVLTPAALRLLELHEAPLVLKLYRYLLSADS